MTSAATGRRMALAAVIAAIGGWLVSGVLAFSLPPVAWRLATQFVVACAILALWWIVDEIGMERP